MKKLKPKDSLTTTIVQVQATENLTHSGLGKRSIVSRETGSLGGQQKLIQSPHGQHGLRLLLPLWYTIPSMWLLSAFFQHVSWTSEHCKYIAGREVKKDGRAKGEQKRTMPTKSVPFYQKDNRVSESHTQSLIFLLRTTLHNHLSL